MAVPTAGLKHTSSNDTTSAPPFLLCLPIDSLHGIASFLASEDWTSFGCTSYGSHRICREILKRVRMHAFRCALEVVTAWKLGQHADARELATVYLSAGVPIYPHSLGHAYQTIIWRMGIESKEMQRIAAEARHKQDADSDQRHSATNDGNNENDGESTTIERDADRHSATNEQPTIDSFYLQRYATRERDQAFFDSMTYLEEKSLFYLPSDPAASRAMDFSQIIRRELSITPNRMRGGRAANMMPQYPGIYIPNHGNDMQQPMDGLAINANRGAAGTTRSPLPNRKLASSVSQPDAGAHTPKLRVKTHRHILDQHLFGRPSLDDGTGTIAASPVSLSVDFFSPSLPAQFIGNQDMESTSGVPPMHPWDTSESASTSDGDAYLLIRNAAEAGLDLRNLAGQEPSEMEDMEADENDSENHNMVAQHSGHPPQDRAGLEFPLHMSNDTSRTSTISLADQNDHHHSPHQTSDIHRNFILSYIDLDVYSTSSMKLEANTAKDDDRQLWKHLETRFNAYKRRLKSLVARGNSSGFDESLLDFWDEFLPQTSFIHYHDGHTPVPRSSCLQKFLTRPCPKAIGVVQCEIERIKLHSKKKGVSIKGRFFPTYEYRLFIRHRTGEDAEESQSPRRDTVLMAARYKGRKDVGTNNKKGANNFCLYMPQQQDVQDHCTMVNEPHDEEAIQVRANGADTSPMKDLSPPTLLGRLQSNFIGTEFQIFSPRIPKLRAHERFLSRTSKISPPQLLTTSEDDDGYDSGAMSDGTSSAVRRRRKVNFRRGHYQADPSTIQEVEATEAPKRSLRRSRSSGNMRSHKSNRRAVANTSEIGRIDSAHTEEESGAITYTANLLGSRPRIMDVCIPRVTGDGVAGLEWKTYLEQADDIDQTIPISSRMLNRFKALQQKLGGSEEHGNTNENTTPEGEAEAGLSSDEGNLSSYTAPNDFGLLALQNRPPWWNAELSSFVLNFGGRVSVASVKNFQLCDRNDQEYVMLQFGRIQGRHSFTMDYQHPLTATQAFAIAISSLQSKISFA